jgi:hypothetical protein
MRSSLAPQERVVARPRAEGTLGKMSDALQIKEMLREVDEHLECLALTEWTRELHSQAVECLKAVDAWDDSPPSVPTTDALLRRVTALLADARLAAERSKGPRSQKIAIV